MDKAQWEWMDELPLEKFPEPYQTIAREIGIPGAVKLAKRFAGTGMYFPKLDDALIELRNRKIKVEFTGANHKALARKYDLTERWIYEILKETEDKDQINLFGNS